MPRRNYFLFILRRGYQKFGQRVEQAEAPAKTDLVRDTILSQEGAFCLADITGQYPSVSPQMVKKVLASLKREGLVELTGRGRSARWTPRRS